jgi:DNA processing protein
LYLRGTLVPSDEKAIAVVGSRHPTEYGKRVATRLGMELARAGYVVVSGLARGIDAAAHRGALQAGGRTLAVLAGGLSRIYPPEHRGLAEEVEKSGALVTESSMKQEPLAGLFPARNRIISGLSKAVVLVEAAEKSGALITASLAADQGRHVLAVPGPIDSEASGGTNNLIRKGAALCRGVEDILEEVEGVSARVAAEKDAPPVPAPTPPNLEGDQARVWGLLSSGSQHLDELVRQLGLGVGALSGMLLTMEMKKLVRRLPGNRYERC